jgi:hypothetical protein
MFDKIFYSLVLFACSGLAGGLAIYGMKKYVTQAMDSMTQAVSEVKNDLKVTRKDWRENFNNVCGERRKVCQVHIAEILQELKTMNEKQWEAIQTHGHKGLDGDSSRVTF